MTRVLCTLALLVGALTACDGDPPDTDAGEADAGPVLEAGPDLVDAFVPRDAGVLPDAFVPRDAGVDACPAEETVCDGADDDCDGEVDEGFDLDADDVNCGACGVTCEADDVCFAGECGPDVPRPVQLAVGRAHTCARMTTGDVRCWGANDRGQLGQGDLAPHEGIVTVTDLRNVVDLAAGPDHTCAITRSGVAVCWGADDQGQIGNGSVGPASVSTPAGVRGGIVGVAQIAAGAVSSCAGSPFGSVHCWGGNGAGQLGDGSTTQRDDAIAVSRGSRLLDDVTVGADHACALERVTGMDPRVVCWGAADGLGASVDAPRPTPGDTLFAAAVEVRAGEGVTCARDAAGRVECAGRDGYGTLGDGATTHADGVAGAPVEAIASGVVALGLSARHACVVLDDGTAACWGSDDHGQLGDDAVHEACEAAAAEDCATAPVAVAALTDVVEIAPGVDHTCARTRDARVFCWGRGDAGQVDGSPGADHAAPVVVAP